MALGLPHFCPMPLELASAFATQRLMVLYCIYIQLSRASYAYRLI